MTTLLEQKEKGEIHEKKSFPHYFKSGKRAMKIIQPSHTTQLSIAALFDVERYCSDGLFEERSFAIVHYDPSVYQGDISLAFHQSRPPIHTLNEDGTCCLQFLLARSYHTLHDDLRHIVLSVPDISIVMYIIEDAFEYQYDAQTSIPDYIFCIKDGHLCAWHKGNGRVGIHDIDVTWGNAHSLLAVPCHCCLCQCS